MPEWKYTNKTPHKITDAATDELRSFGLKDEPEVMAEAERIGKLIKERIKTSKITAGDSNCNRG